MLVSVTGGNGELPLTGADGAGARAAWRGSNAVMLLLVAALIATAAIAVLWLIAGPGAVLQALEHGVAWIRAHQGAALAVLGVWAFVSQIAPMPSGTLTMLAAGYLFGWPAALVYFAAMAASGQLVHAGVGAGLGDAPERWVETLQKRWPRSDLSAWTAAARREGVAVTAALRSLPFLPSAAAAIAAAGLGVSSRALLLGTLLTGWIRPLAVVTIGAALSSLAEASRPIDLTGTGAGLAIVAVALIVPAVAAARCLRRL